MKVFCLINFNQLQNVLVHGYDATIDMAGYKTQPIFIAIMVSSLIA